MEQMAHNRIHDRKLDETDIERVFNTADADRSGHVSIGELMLFLRRCGLNVSQSRCFEIMDIIHVGKPNDNRLDLDEFTTFFKSAFPGQCLQPIRNKEIQKFILEQPKETRIFETTRKFEILNKKIPVDYSKPLNEFQGNPNQLKKLTDEELEQIFAEIDTSHLGKIRVSELMLYLGKNNYKFSNKRCFEQLNSCNCDKDDDEMNLREFISIYRGAIQK